MPACDFCEKGEGLVSWQQRQPRAGHAWACEPCASTLRRAAGFEARSWEDLVLLEGRARSEGGEVWDAGGTDYWFAPGVTTTPTTANLRRTLVSVRMRS